MYRHAYAWLRHAAKATLGVVTTWHKRGTKGTRMDAAHKMYAQLFRHYRNATGTVTYCAEQSGWSHPYISRIERGQRVPDLPTAADFDQAFGADGVIYDATKLLREADRKAASIEPQNHVDSLDEREMDELERRQLLQALGMTGAAGVTGAFGHLDAIRATLEDALGRSVEEWQEIAWEYGRDVLTMPPTELLEELGRDVLAVRRLLDRPPSAADRASLQRVAAQLSVVSAVTFGNLGETSRARGWWRTARTAADRSGDPELGAHVRGWWLIDDLHHGGLPEDVATAAEHTLRVAPDSGAGRMTALSALAQGRALAGDPSATRTVDEQADAFAALPEDVDRSRASFWGWAEQRLHFVRSYVYTCLGDSRAPAAYDAALALYPRGLYQEPTQIKLYRAAWLARGGDPSEGLRHATRAVGELPHQYRDRLVMAAARDVQRALPAGAETTPEADEYRELLAASS